MHKFLSMAIDLAHEHVYDDDLDYHLCAIIVRGGSVVSVGFNKRSRNGFVDYVAERDTTPRSATRRRGPTSTLTLRCPRSWSPARRSTCAVASCSSLGSSRRAWAWRDRATRASSRARCTASGN